jgi:two-component system CheB/CheR fusion protein
VVARKTTSKARAKDPPGVATVPEAVAEEVGVARFPIVGLGASAGGLEAFEQFFRHLPPDTGMGFVLVSHLDPGHASMLCEILQRTTAMPVVEAEDQMAVMPDRVYVIPPNRDMAIFHGALQLNVPEMPRGQRMPIDGFLRSLADDQKEWAIGVILSGTGTDGTLGLRAIVGAGGVSFVQDPATAKYSGMPASAIQAGYATQVLPVEKMPQAMLDSVRYLAGRQAMLSRVPTAATGMNRILMLLRSGTGHDFSQYKKGTIVRRIERRMSQHDIEDTEVYARYLKEHPDEVRALFKELLISVTSFFRDPDAFATLQHEVLPQLFAGKPEGYAFRVWVAGCASGEEAYSIAMLLREFMDETRQEFKVQIYATDIGDEAIAVARSGTYPLNIAQDVAPERLRRFFIKEDAGYRVKKEIREMVVFAIQDVIKDPPFTKLDLLSCRNLMIYLEPELQHRLVPALHFGLKPGGVLFVSPSEGIGGHSKLFATLSRKWKFYRAIPSAASTRAAMTRSLTWAAERGVKPPYELVTKAKETSLADLANRTLLQSYAPPSVVTDLRGNILFVHGETGKYLRPAPGQATLNVIEMAREGLELELRAAVHHAASQDRPILSREASVRSNGDFRGVSFSVRPLPNPDTGEGLLLVSFQDMAPLLPPKPRHLRRRSEWGAADVRHIEELQRELDYSKQNLQVAMEEQQASNEELKSTNEEMQSTNEELQSTNEELETSKEELQSVNEELITVNAELQSKIEQLASMQNDMKNLLDNTSIGVVFLDEHLLIRHFTREAAQVYRLVASDVGRPLADIRSNVEGDDLLAETQAVLDSLAICEREVRTAKGVSYLARIQPYRTLDNRIDGVVLTFTDITERIAAIAAREGRELAEAIVDTVLEPLVVLNGALQVVSASRSFYSVFRTIPEETIGRPLYDLGNRQWDIPALRELLETILPRDRSFEGYVVEHNFPGIGRHRMRLNARRIVGKTDTQLILLALDAASPAPAEKAAP